MPKDFPKIFSVILLGLSAIILVVAGLYYLFGLKQLNISQNTRLIIPILFVIDGLAYFVGAYGVLKGIKLLFYFAFTVLVVNIVLFIFDEIGFLDVAVLIANIIILILVALEFKKAFPKK